MTTGNMPRLTTYRTTERGPLFMLNQYRRATNTVTIGAAVNLRGRVVSLQWRRPNSWDWKPVRCMIGAHDWSPVIRIGHYLRMCRRCYIQKVVPDP